MKPIEVLIVRVGKPAEVATIENKWESFSQVVGGWIEPFYPFTDNVCIVCNEEGKINGMMPNRIIYDDYGRIVDVVHGDFVVCGLRADNFASLSKKNIDKYLKYFNS